MKKILIVDDHADIRRLIRMTLEFEDCEIREAGDAVAGWQLALQFKPDLVLLDVMMPGETHGLDLLQHLADHPAQRGAARVAVFSAGLTAAMQSRLDTFDVWRQLSKPISLTALEDCVREAVVARSAAPADAKSACAAGDESLSDDERAAIDRHFGGEQALFIAFRASCRAQFAADLQAGDAAVASTLFRLCASRRSAAASPLATLGHPGPGATARTLEDAAAAADWASATPLWQLLRAHLTSGG